MLTTTFIRSTYLFSLTILLWTVGFCAIADAKPDRPSPMDSAALDTDTTPYMVLGHRALLQSIVQDDAAWTLGEDGVLIAWIRNQKGWTPLAVRSFADTLAFARVHDHLWLFARDGIRAIDAGSLQESSSKVPTDAKACGNGTVWVQRDNLLCTNATTDHDLQCTNAKLRAHALTTATCVQDKPAACLTIHHGGQAYGWCLQQDGDWQHATSRDHTALLRTSHDGVTWFHAPSLRLQHEQAAAIQDEPANVTPTLACIDASSMRGCRRTQRNNAPITTPVSSRIPQSALSTDKHFIVLYTDGWYTVPRDISAVEPTTTRSDDALSFASFGSVWLDGIVIGSGVVDGEPHVTYCSTEKAHRSVIDINIQAEESTLLQQNDSPCPTRAFYQDGNIRLIYPNHDMLWQSADQHLVDVPKQVRAQHSRAATWYVTRQASRACQAYQWTLMFKADGIEDFPLDQAFCASSVLPIQWIRAHSGQESPGFMLVHDAHTELLLIDDRTLQRRYLRIPELLDANTRVVQHDKDVWLLFSPTTGTAKTFSPTSGLSESFASIWWMSNLWVRQAYGNYTNADQGTLLVTDDGMVLDGHGSGPVTRRTIRKNRQRVEDDPHALVQALRYLSR